MEEENNTLKRNALLIGAVVGALVGVVAANVFVKQAEEAAEEGDGEAAITPQKGFKLGMIVMGLLKQISSL